MVAIIDEIMINFNSCANAKKALFKYELRVIQHNRRLKWPSPKELDHHFQRQFSKHFNSFSFCLFEPEAK